MNAASARAELGAVGRDLVAGEGGPGARRGAALLRSLAGHGIAPIALDALAEVPDWARLPWAAQRRIAQRVALLAMAPALARSIDGRRLGALAAVAGGDAIDWAIEVAGERDGGVPLTDGNGLEPTGFALLRLTLPKPLHPLLDRAPVEAPPCEAPLAAACLATVLRAEAHA